MTDCQGNPVVNLGQKDLALRGPTGRSFARVTVASVAKNLLSVSSLLKTGHEVVFSSGKSYIQHLKTDARQPIVEKNGVCEVSYDLSPCAVGLKPPPSVDQGQEERHEAAVRAGGGCCSQTGCEDVRDLEQQSVCRRQRTRRCPCGATRG